MRGIFTYLVLLGLAVLAAVVLLPLLGVLLLMLAAGVGFLFAAPYLARLPWFRNWIHVERRGPFRTVRFGERRQGREPGAQRADGDVIDVQPRVLGIEGESEKTPGA